MGFVRTRSVLQRFVLFVLFAATQGACHSPDSRPVDLPQMFAPTSTSGPAAANDRSGSVERAFLMPGGNYSMVTVRTRAEVPRSGDATVVCAAPSPDWATAIAMAQQLSASGSITGKESASIAGSNNFTETISAMAGRTAGVVALRDGLYNACQAYANGVIGKDAYALILSQYGNLLVALAGNNGGGGSGSGSGGGGGGGGSATPPASTPAGVAVAVSTGAVAPSGSTASAKDSGSTAGSAGNAQVAQMQQQLMQALLVACVSENDPTTHSQYAPTNSLLTPQACAPLINKIVDAAQILLTPAGASAAGKTATGKPTPDPVIMAVQNALARQGADIEVDGINGPNTMSAVRAYQKAKGLTVNGDPRDPATLKELGVGAGRS